MTLREIAEEVGVSISTVSRVVNSRNPHAATPELQQAIWECVRKTGYKPNNKMKNAAVSVVQTIPVRFIACIFARNKTSVSDNTFFSGLSKSFEKTALSMNYITQSFFTAVELNEANLDAMAQQNLAGVVIFGRHDKELVNRIKHIVPHVVYAGLARPADDDYDAIICDRYKIGITAAEYFIRQGHKTIGYIGEIDNEITFDGFSETIRNNGLVLEKENVVNIFASMENGYLGMKRMLENKNRPTAVLCMNDYLAMGVLRAIHESNITCPQDISILGVDDIESANYSTPKLTTFHTPMEELGTIAAKTLIDRIEGGHTIPLKIFLPFSIIERESCQAPSI